ncbi:MAG TPA: hypothetical protein DIC52_16300 [Candidatus Latescibacteria bacterium]|jgi:putative aminopeptidase FrvX|nr:hypothetical protein [Candidatus Latescibacterota bacterium]
MSETYLDILHRLLPLPTAPFYEQHVMAEILRFAAERSLPCAADDFGNLMLTAGGSEAKPELCLTAHMDHPALGFAVHESSRDLLFERLGGVPSALTRDARVLLYDRTPAAGARAVPVGAGSVTSFLEEGVPGSPNPSAPAFRVRIDDEVPEEGDLFAVWDLTPCALKGEQIVGRACDDLAGVCVALATMDCCLAEGVSLSVLLTRAEETGFGGMLAALAADGLDREAIYVNIECSSCRSGAPLGAGPVIRVGDRRWIFDAGVTEALCRCAAELAQRLDGFSVQRRLMDGGVCEATPLSRSGRATGAVALPLDNYHNDGGQRLRSEAVHLRDAENLVSLLTDLARQRRGANAMVAESLATLDDMLRSRHISQVDRLRRTTNPMSQP